MKLKALDDFFDKGIEMKRLKTPATYGGLFSSSSPATYEYKLIHDYQELAKASYENWWFENEDMFTLYFLEAVYYGLKELAEKYEDIKNLPATKDTPLSP